MHEAERGDTVRRIAREGDPDRALAALFAPREPRADLFALYAFNVELARIAEQVSEPGLGAIRLQWWREAVERAAKGEATGHPVADAIGAALKRRRLTRRRIEALIDARSFDVETKIMPDWASLEAYLADTAGALFALGAECLGARGPSLEPASSQAGLAYGLTGLMRALPVHAASGRVDLPADALIRHGTSPESVLAGKTSDGLLVVLAEMRRKARDALDAARHHVAQLDAPAQTAFLPLCLVNPHLAALEKSGRDPLREIAGINPLTRLWRMASWNPSGRRS
ncbi:MAG: squalene/phytoene synthase family protein [Methyloceanibacter sp.]|nr:squalene/phytoene synthase family protein [Methyloceanibacter sp.]